MRSRHWLVVATLFLLVSLFPASAFAQRGFRGGGFRGGGFRGGRVVVVRPSIGFGFGWGPYWGGYWNPWYGYGYPDVVQVRRVDYGTLDFKVKPENTQVYVDQKYLGTIKELDHHKAYLAGGYHNIRLVAPDGRAVDRSVYVAVGRTVKIEEHL